MVELNSQHQLVAALAELSGSRTQVVRSAIASALSTYPDLESQEQIREMSVGLETSLRKYGDAVQELASAVVSIRHPEARENLRQGFIHLVKSLNVIQDRALNGDAESLSKRHEWVRKVRSRLQNPFPMNDDLFRMLDAHLAALENALLPPSDGGAATLVLEPTVAESLVDDGGFPQCWELLAYLLPRDARQRIYEPAQAELLEDYLVSRSCRRGRWSRLAVDCVFLVRTLLLAGECGRVLFASGAVKFWLWLMGLVVAIIRLTQRPPE